MYQMVTSNHVGLTLRYTKVHAHAHVCMYILVKTKRWALPADSHAVHSPTHHVRSVLRPCTHLCWLWAMGASFRDRGVCACHICMYMYDERRTPWAEDAPRRPSGRFRAPALFRCALTPVFELCDRIGTCSRHPQRSRGLVSGWGGPGLIYLCGGRPPRCRRRAV